VKSVGMLMGLLLVAWCTLAVAQEKPAPPAASISVGDKQAIDANMNKEATVEGTVSDAEWSPTGRVFLIKFQEGETTQFQGAVLSQNKETMEKGLNGDLSNALEGAKIQIKGKLVTYREHPEILIDKPEQIRIVQKGSGTSPHAQTASPTRSGAAAESGKQRLFGVYGNLNVTDEQRQKIAAIQKEAYDAERAFEQKLRDESDAKIVPLLSDEQKEQLRKLKEEAQSRYQARSAASRPAEKDRD